jgi:hypothetical protein
VCPCLDRPRQSFHRIRIPGFSSCRILALYHRRIFTRLQLQPHFTRLSNKRVSISCTLRSENVSRAPSSYPRASPSLFLLPGSHPAFLELARAPRSTFNRFSKRVDVALWRGETPEPLHIPHRAWKRRATLRHLLHLPHDAIFEAERHTEVPAHQRGLHTCCVG